LPPELVDHTNELDADAEFSLENRDDDLGEEDDASEGEHAGALTHKIVLEIIIISRKKNPKKTYRKDHFVNIWKPDYPRSKCEPLSWYS
jgi:hypothetical protein